MIEGRHPLKHLIKQHPHQIPVQTHIMPLLPDHLRCQIRIRPTKRLRQIPSLEPILRQPKISDLCMPLIIQHHILRLQIPKDHPSGV